MSYSVKTISLQPPRRVFNEYYKGRCRQKATRIIQHLQQKGVAKIEFTDVPNGCIYEYILKNQFNEYRIIKNQIR